MDAPATTPATPATPAAPLLAVLHAQGIPDAPLAPALEHLADTWRTCTISAPTDLIGTGADAVLLVTADRAVVATLRDEVEAAPSPPALLVAWTGPATPEAADLGVADCLPLAALGPELLERALRYAVQRQRLEREVAFLAQHDALTGLANEDLFTRQVRHAVHVARRHNQPLAVFCVRMDNPQDALEGLGAMATNELISAFGARLTDLLRRSDLVARAHDAEFLVLLEQVEDNHELAQAASKLRTGLAERFVLNHAEAFLTVSIGMAVFPRSADDGDALVAAARTAADKAATGGGNDFRLYDTELATVSRRRLRMEESLPEALGHREFQVWYQPQYSLHDADRGAAHPSGAEALLRWHGQELGKVDPEVFIPVAEETGAILRIGEWVLQQAGAAARGWHEQLAAAVRISVNVSGRQFRDQRLLEDVRRLVQATGLDPALLELELTERVFVKNLDEHRAVFHGLRDMGVQIALDDFGIGYSSLAYLKNFPVDCLKIDRSFVANLPDSADDVAITRAIIAMGHSLGMRIVAEGIETPEQLATLHAEGCDEVQGYLVGRPLPADDFINLLLDDSDPVAEHLARQRHSASAGG